MSETYCPACGEEMERIDCAPCYDCGHVPEELEHFRNDDHEYHLFEVFGQEIVLCDFCDADFGSYYPDYFGLPGDFPIEYNLKFIKKIYEPKCEPDFYCSKCKHRLRFIKFLLEAREHNKNVI